MPRPSAIQHAGLINVELSEREGRVVPLAKEWDRLKAAQTIDREAVKRHIAACYLAECPDMARRAERLLAGKPTPYRTTGIKLRVVTVES